MAAQTAALTGLARVNLRQQALTALRRAITTGALAPGTHLVETELSEQLQVSRGTLREALRQLQQEGLVSAGPRGWLSVRTLGAPEVLDVFAVRAALESMAVRTLSRREDRAAVVTALRERVRAMEQVVDRPLEDRVEADLDFHRALCELTGNATLLHTWQALEGSIRMSIMWAGTERAVSNMRVDRHAAIVDVIDAGDVTAAVDCVQAHMDEAAANLVS
ncbi:GntR family transcriptional regulator [Desertihabitans aurantiacus]|uniref:GntR family transcriptional regulator n=1 Tax=Desertihabitans aurantiacus TaxID=2282477 RepID=UPI000DF73BB6|nr:GntR family transcriptional regulator [Desertihabitans aurantiacus]